MSMRFILLRPISLGSSGLCPIIGPMRVRQSGGLKLLPGGQDRTHLPGRTIRCRARLVGPRDALGERDGACVLVQSHRCSGSSILHMFILTNDSKILSSLCPHPNRATSDPAIGGVLFCSVLVTGSLKRSQLGPAGARTGMQPTRNTAWP
jgi:hypothetical protein